MKFEHDIWSNLIQVFILYLCKNGVQMANKLHHLEGILGIFVFRYVDRIIITVLVAYSHYYAPLDDHSLHLNSKYVVYDMRVFDSQIHALWSLYASQSISGELPLGA